MFSRLFHPFRSARRANKTRPSGDSRNALALEPLESREVLSAGVQATMPVADAAPAVAASPTAPKGGVTGDVAAANGGATTVGPSTEAALTSAAAPSGSDQQFIASAYQQFLNRSPDPAGLDFWTHFLNQQTQAVGSAQARSEMTDAIMASPEYRRDVVTNIYQDFLKRAPDPGGLAYWATQLGRVGESAVLSDILASPEYESLHGGTTAGLVNGLYSDLLGRAPDPTGEAYWLNQFGRAAVGNSYENLGLYNNGVAAQVQQLLNTHEGRLLLLNNGTGDSALSHFTGQGWNQLFFQGNANRAAQNAFFANYEANPSFELALQQLLNKGGYFEGGIAQTGGVAAGLPIATPGSGDVPPSGYPVSVTPTTAPGGIGPAAASPAGAETTAGTGSPQLPGAAG
jgi:hypothetical protein